MPSISWLIAAAVLLVIILVIRHQIKRHQQATFINNYNFPSTISAKVKVAYPHLSEREVAQVIQGLREYFHVINLSGNRLVAMPSQVIDVAWHEFILFTRQYQTFCRRALGRFLHHTPAEAMKSKTAAQDGIKRAWRIACHREHINPHSPERLPLIFALDAKLNINDGFHYQLNCKAKNSPATSNGGYCGSHIGCSSGCSGSSGDSDSGCGGGGCGGD